MTLGRRLSMGRKHSKKKLVSAALEPEQAIRLKKLSEQTRVPQQVYLREAVEDMLRKYERKLKRK